MDADHHVTAFGANAPSIAQRCVIALAHATPLGRGWLRPSAARFINWLRLGPIDQRVGGAAFRLHCGDNAAEIGLLLKANFDQREIAFLASGLDGGVFVDVGANVGAYTLLVAAACGWRCRVVAIEPLASLAQRLRVNATLNGFGGVTVIEHAVGETEGVLPLAIDAGNLGATSASGEGGLIVPMQPLAAVLREAGIESVTALKIDVEGYEDRVLVPFFRDAARTSWPRRVVVEHLGRDAWREDCIADMSARGYVTIAKTRSNTLLSLSN